MQQQPCCLPSLLLTGRSYEVCEERFDLACSCCGTDHAYLEHNFSTLNFNRQFNHIQSGSLHTAHPQKQSSHAVMQAKPFAPKEAKEASNWSVTIIHFLSVPIHRCYLRRDYTRSQW
jgi:hypothetical protein